jgi:hypothetical protein
LQEHYVFVSRRGGPAFRLRPQHTGGVRRAGDESTPGEPGLDAEPPGGRPRAGAPQEIVGLARGWLGQRSDVSYAPQIPSLKEMAARAAHDAYLPEGEPVLVLYDGTLLGSADNGFLVTPERLCWKNFFEHPRQIAWSEIEPASIVPDVGRVAISGGSIVVSGDLVSHAARFLAEMASRARRERGGPYRRAVDADGEPAAVARLAMLARRLLGEVEDLHYHPAIPPQKLRRARAAHAARLPAREAVAVLYDDTLFGGAEEGFLLTANRLCYKNLSTGPASVAWVDLDPEGVSQRRNVVYVPGGALLFTAQGELAVPVAALLARLGREARGPR